MISLSHALRNEAVPAMTPSRAAGGVSGKQTGSLNQGYEAMKIRCQPSDQYFEYHTHNLVPIYQFIVDI
jgi:hypothetical protein